MISFVVGDITKQETTAIVNAANGMGVLGSGVAGAIARAGGSEVEKEFGIYCRKFNPKAGSAFITTAGNMESWKVIHAVSMRFPGTSYRENQREGLQIVLNCYDNVFALFTQYTYKSIAVCALGTGVGGLNKKNVAKILIHVLNHYELIDDESREILICDMDADFIEYCKEYINKLDK